MMEANVLSKLVSWTPGDVEENGRFLPHVIPGVQDTILGIKSCTKHLLPLMWFPYHL